MTSNNEGSDYTDDPRLDPGSIAAKRYTAMMLGILLEPAECDANCRDPFCHYIHRDHWLVGGESFTTVDAALAAHRKQNPPKKNAMPVKLNPGQEHCPSCDGTGVDKLTKKCWTCEGTGRKLTHLDVTDGYLPLKHAKNDLEECFRVYSPENGVRPAVSMSQPDAYIDKIATIKRFRSIHQHAFNSGVEAVFKFLEGESGENRLFVNELRDALHDHWRRKRLVDQLPARINVQDLNKGE